MVALARQLGLEALAITDHDTLEAYELARPAAQAAGLDLVCGIEISTRLSIGRPVHLLGYFLHHDPYPHFYEWLKAVYQIRHDRNQRLEKRLEQIGVPVTLEEAEALGHSITGRVHFARLMVEKGYVQTVREAFLRYLSEDAPGYVPMDDPPVEEGIRRIREAGGLAVLAHPFRLRLPDPDQEETLLRKWRDAGLDGLEVWHTDHPPLAVERYLRIAREMGFAMSGGTDYHGTAKPGITLGGVRVSSAVLRGLREYDLHRRAA
jgi:hypothetical protein